MKKFILATLCMMVLTINCVFATGKEGVTNFTLADGISMQINENTVFKYKDLFFDFDTDTTSYYVFAIKFSNSTTGVSIIKNTTQFAAKGFNRFYIKNIITGFVGTGGQWNTIYDQAELISVTPIAASETMPAVPTVPATQ